MVWALQAEMECNETWRQAGINHRHQKGVDPAPAAPLQRLVLANERFKPTNPGPDDDADALGVLFRYHQTGTLQCLGAGGNGKLLEAIQTARFFYIQYPSRVKVAHFACDPGGQA